MPDTFPYVNINLQEVRTRNDAARHIVAGFATAFPALADIWPYIQNALDDALTLLEEIKRLSAELLSARLDRANLVAAARATIAADREGEPDPLFYLRDELDAFTGVPDHTRGQA